MLFRASESLSTFSIYASCPEYMCATIKLQQQQTKVKRNCKYTQKILKNKSNKTKQKQQRKKLSPLHFRFDFVTYFYYILLIHNKFYIYIIRVFFRFINKCYLLPQSSFNSIFLFIDEKIQLILDDHFKSFR